MSIKVRIDREKFKKDFEAKVKGIKKAVAEGIQETDSVSEIQSSYDQSGLRVRSGRLYHSFKEEKTEDTLTVSSTVPYARIHDQGGMTGRNHKTPIRATYYVTNAVEKIKRALLSAIKSKLPK